MNGTCYTAEECSDKKGKASGSCANGFGVCCVSKYHVFYQAAGTAEEAQLLRKEVV